MASKYQVFRNRSGSIEGFEKRINVCIERSLNGQKLDPESKEMSEMLAQMKWLGQEVNLGKAPKGFGLLSLPLPFLN